jgi:hypothetical protein
MVGIRSAKTLRKHFQAELSSGMADANAVVARVAYEMAISGRFPAMSFFWTKCQSPRSLGVETEEEPSSYKTTLEFHYRERDGALRRRRENSMPRSRFEPSDEQRQNVRALAGFGLSHKQIATVVEVASVDTLRKYFADELTRGPLEAQSNVMRTLFRLASSGRNPAATMFWLKTQVGWSEQGKVEEREPPRHIVWHIHEHQPPRSAEDQKKVEELLRRHEDAPAKPVRWGGDKGYYEDDEDEAPQRRRPC